MSVRTACAVGLVAVALVSHSCGKKDSGGSTTTPSPSGGGAANLAGTVTDVVSGAPVASATVAVQGKSVTTGADGKYSFTGLTAAADTLTSKHQGHRNFSQAVTLSSQGTVNIQMTTAPEAGVAGAWGGQWKNNTFGSSGAAGMTATVDTVAQTFQSTMTLGGSVFGRGTPPPQTVNLNYSPTSGATFNGTSSFFGTVNATARPGAAIAAATRFGPFLTTVSQLSGNMTNVPGGTIARVDFAGTGTTTDMNVTYTVTFVSGGPATGTIVLTKSGSSGGGGQATDRYVCDSTGSDRSALGNFTVAKYNGTTLTQVDLTFTEKDATGINLFTAELTATAASGGSGTATAGITISKPDQSVPASFFFSPAVSVTPGAQVDFRIKQLTGPSEDLHYEGLAQGCPVTFQIGHPPVHIYGAP